MLRKVHQAYGGLMVLLPLMERSLRVDQIPRVGWMQMRRLTWPFLS